MYALTKRYSLVLLCALSILLISSCDNNKTSHAISIEGMATAEGPFFEGPNTFQANFKLTESSNWDKSWQLNTLKKGGAKSLIVTCNDSSTFDLYNSVSVQLLAKDLPMISLGAMSKLPEGANSIEIELSNEADITNYLKADKITVILDVDFKNEDYTEQLQFPLSLNLNVEL